MAGTLYRTLWRWHFYAGLIVIPLVMVLALSGAAYLFKPQVDRWEERAFHGLPAQSMVAPARQRDAALAAFPGARFQSFRLPETPADAALVLVALPGGASREVYVAPDGHVVGALDPQGRIMQVVHDLHGQLLAGKPGGWVVELGGNWALVLILTGLYLWWPRGRGLAGVLWPRLGRGSRTAWRDLHAVSGFWVSALALVLLVTALPWTSVWGGALRSVREVLAGQTVRQDWTLGGRKVDAAEHAGHVHGPTAMPGMAPAAGPDLLDAVVARAHSENLSFPALVTPPTAPGGPWIAKSDAQNRPLRATITFDGVTGKRLRREDFSDKPLVDRIVGYGVAWHEGQLFGWINQLIGMITAALLLLVAATGFVQWRRRKPVETLGAPPAPVIAAPREAWAILLIAAAFLPLLALSLAAFAAFEAIARRWLPGTARWLGLRPLASA